MEYHLKTPVPDGDLVKLRVGDVIYLTGTIVTARDEAHKKALELHEAGEKPPVDFGGIGIFHCGPIMRKTADGWMTVAAGPTTSDRMEIFQDKFIEAFRPAVIIGKGGMGNRTAEACKKFHCVYGAFTGGAALLAAERIKRVKDVFWLEEFGMPECLWVFEADEFGPMIVTIDTLGENLTAKLAVAVKERRDKILGELK
jgi:tartrate/fumarate subfamily iron-sulfur-dependent hydro-lyase beta chain